MRIAVYCPHYEDAGGVREVVRRLNAGMAARFQKQTRHAAARRSHTLLS